MDRNSFRENYGLLTFMVCAIIAGCILGAVWPNVYDTDGQMMEKGASYLAPLGKIFINLMFCIVVPMVFASIAGAVANMPSRKRAGKVMGTTIGAFLITGAIAA
ncbi:MAG: cation:dicarboxylate symporter family transporter, partial [Anaerovoracaceae bacterium]